MNYVTASCRNEELGRLCLNGKTGFKEGEKKKKKKRKERTSKHQTSNN